MCAACSEPDSEQFFAALRVEKDIEIVMCARGVRVRGGVGERFADLGIVDQPGGKRVQNGLRDVGAFIAEKGIPGIGRASPRRNFWLHLIGQ